MPWGFSPKDLLRGMGLDPFSKGLLRALGFRFLFFPEELLRGTGLGFLFSQGFVA